MPGISGTSKIGDVVVVWLRGFGRETTPVLGKIGALSARMVTVNVEGRDPMKFTLGGVQWGCSSDSYYRGNSVESFDWAYNPTKRTPEEYIKHHYDVLAEKQKRVDLISKVSDTIFRTMSLSKLERIAAIIDEVTE
jgi:hypothetical protein